MEHRVFQKVRQHLLDEHGVHRDDDEVLRKLYFHRYAGVELLEPHQHRIHQLFQHGGRLLDGDAVGVDAVTESRSTIRLSHWASAQASERSFIFCSRPSES